MAAKKEPEAKKLTSRKTTAKKAKGAAAPKTKSKSARLIEFENDPTKMTLLAGWARDGLSQEQIAKNMGISRSTFNEWCRLSSDISDTIKKNKEVSDFEVENSCYKSACGYYVINEKEEEVLKDGEIITLHKKYKTWIPPNAACIFFWLKNREPDKWRDKVPELTDSENDNAGLIQIAPVLESDSNG